MGLNSWWQRPSLCLCRRLGRTLRNSRVVRRNDCKRPRPHAIDGWIQSACCVMIQGCSLADGTENLPQHRRHMYGITRALLPLPSTFTSSPFALCSPLLTLLSMPALSTDAKLPRAFFIPPSHTSPFVQPLVPVRLFEFPLAPPPSLRDASLRKKF